MGLTLFSVGCGSAPFAVMIPYPLLTQFLTANARDMGRLPPLP